MKKGSVLIESGLRELREDLLPITEMKRTLDLQWWCGTRDRTIGERVYDIKTEIINLGIEYAKARE